MSHIVCISLLYRDRVCLLLLRRVRATFKQLCRTSVEMQLSRWDVLKSHFFQGVISKRTDKKWYTDKRKSKKISLEWIAWDGRYVYCESLKCGKTESLINMGEKFKQQ